MIAFLIKALFFLGFWGEEVEAGAGVELCEGSPGSPGWCWLHRDRQWHTGGMPPDQGAAGVGRQGEGSSASTP